MLNASSIAEKVAARRAAGRPTKEITLPKCGESMRIRQLNLLERDDYNLSMLGESGKLDHDKLRGNKARLIAACAVDDSNKPFLGIDDIVEGLDLEDIDFAHDNCVEFNGLGKKATEEAGGNS